MAAMSPFHIHFTRQARYHVWATHRLLDAVSRLSDDEYKRDVGLFFKSIHGTLNHLLVGEHLLTHHRGQITAALTALGQPGPELDWVYHLQLEAAEAKKP